jgi:hypothetical protein
LFGALVPQGLDRIVMDLRRPAGLESIDRQTILSFQKAGVLPPQVSYVFRQPSVEPLLWIADGIAGAVADDVSGDPQYLAVIAGITNVQVAP